jgi:hypothetical protein
MTQTYNNLLHITEAQNIQMHKVPLILEMIKKYNFEDKIGVARLHKHFELKEDEKVVWSYNQKENRSKV